MSLCVLARVEGICEHVAKGLIYPSSAQYKLRQFLDKSEGSLLIAKHHLSIPSESPKEMFWFPWSNSYFILFNTLFC